MAAFVASLLVAVSSLHASQPVLLEALGAGEKMDGVGCETRLTEVSGARRTILITDDGSFGMVKTKGKLIHLSLAGSTAPRARKSGDRFSFSYEGDDLRISYAGVRTNVPGVTTLKHRIGPFESRGRLTIKRGNLRETIEVIERRDPCDAQ